ncbi:hypothetical protein D3C73_1415780 [compost metagenome]
MWSLLLPLYGGLALPGGGQVRRWCFLALLDEAVKQDHGVSIHGKKYPGDRVLKVDPGLP